MIIESGLSLIAFAICISFSFEAPTLLCINGEKHAQTKEVFWDPAQAPRAYSGSRFYCLSLARTWSELLDIAFCLSGAEQLLSNASDQVSRICIPRSSRSTFAWSWSIRQEIIAWQCNGSVPRTKRMNQNGMVNGGDWLSFCCASGSRQTCSSACKPDAAASA